MRCSGLSIVVVGFVTATSVVCFRWPFETMVSVLEV